jgi:ACS family hexuronate transporter-like MFS transporter
LAVARFVLGLGEGACFPGATKGACEWFPPEKRGLALGIAIGGSAFGSVLAPPLTAWLAAGFGWRGAFLATGIFGAAWVLAWLVAGCFAPATRVADSTGSQPTWGDVFQQPAVWPILLARFCFDPVFYFYMFWIPQYLARERGFSLDEIGKYYWIPFLALGVSNILSGHWADLLLGRGWSPRRTRFTLLALAAFVTPVSCMVILTPSAVWAIGLMAVLMAAHGLWICNYIALISDYFPSRVMATVVGLSGTVGGTAGIIANLVTGPVVDSQGFAPIFVCTSFLYPLAFLLLLASPRTIASSQESP